MLDNWVDAPQGAIHPEKLEKKGLFSLDVNGMIWKGLKLLGEGLGNDCAPPRWLADENMHLAIIAHLDFQGCEIELNIIKCEVKNMHVWYTKELLAVKAAIQDSGACAYNSRCSQCKYHVL
jgi:hypothetical protein